METADNQQRAGAPPTRPTTTPPTRPTVASPTRLITAYPAPAVPAPAVQPDAAPPRKDRRSRRSQRLMLEAFTGLADERGLGNFTVGDLVDRADLNRSTFYAHYNDLDHLLRLCKQEVTSDLLALKPRLQAVSLAEMQVFQTTGVVPAVTIELFDMLREHSQMLTILLGPHGDQEFQTELRDVICSELIRSVLHEKYTKEPSVLVDYYIAYYAAALLGMIQHWLLHGLREDSQTIARIMLSIMFLQPGEAIVIRDEWGEV